MSYVTHYYDTNIFNKLYFEYYTAILNLKNNRNVIFSKVGYEHHSLYISKIFYNVSFVIRILYIDAIAIRYVTT